MPGKEKKEVKVSTDNVVRFTDRVEKLGDTYTVETSKELVTK